MTHPVNKNRICLCYEHNAEEAAAFYARTFPDSSVGAAHRTLHPFGQIPTYEEGV